MDAALLPAFAGPYEPPMIYRTAALLSLMLLSACSAAKPPASTAGGGVVSLDYCADQMVLGLVPPDQILAVSPEADSDSMFSAPRARGIARVRPILEDIVKLRPRYAVRLYGGAPALDRQLAAAGVRVIELGAPSALAEVPAELARVGKILGTERQAAILINGWKSDLAALPRPAPVGQRPKLLYITPGDVTTGQDGFVGDLINRAGFRSVRNEDGWGSLPLESMVRQPPDVVLRAFFDNVRYQQDHWSSSAHPRLGQMIAGRPTVTAAGSALGCGNWLAGGTIRQLSSLHARLERRK